MGHKSVNKGINYAWLLHIAIWVVLFGMPFFSPRPGHPLHGDLNYSRFVPAMVSFFVVFYINYSLLIRKYLFTKKFGWFVVWNIILIATASLLVHFVSKGLFPGPPEIPRHPAYLPPERLLDPKADRGFMDTLSFVSRNTLIYLAVICAAIAVRMTGRWYKDESKRNEIEKIKVETELVNLKSQINPHFLFNTLNNIYSLIQIDRTKAQDAIHDLSGMLRYVLYESENAKVPLSKEESFIKDYIKLMSMRLTPLSTVDVAIEDNVSNAEIAPMLFIPLVENAFKHGVSDTEPSFIKVDIHEEEGQVLCLVENSYYPKADHDRSGSGVGLNNLKKRLDLLYPGNYSFEEGKTKNIYRSLLKITMSQ